MSFWCASQPIVFLQKKMDDRKDTKARDGEGIKQLQTEKGYGYEHGKV